jgi:hypothetical protein
MNDAIDQLYRANLIVEAWSQRVRDQSVEQAAELLCGAARLIDVTPLLELADRIDPQFAAAYRMSCARQDKRRLTNAYWDRDSEAYRRVLAWLEARN